MQGGGQGRGKPALSLHWTRAKHGSLRWASGVDGARHGEAAGTGPMYMHSAVCNGAAGGAETSAQPAHHTANYRDISTVRSSHSKQSPRPNAQRSPSALRPTAAHLSCSGRLLSSTRRVCVCSVAHASMTHSQRSPRTAGPMLCSAKVQLGPCSARHVLSSAYDSAHLLGHRQARPRLALTTLAWRSVHGRSFSEPSSDLEARARVHREAYYILNCEY